MFIRTSAKAEQRSISGSNGESIKLFKIKMPATNSTLATGPWTKAQRRYALCRYGYTAIWFYVDVTFAAIRLIRRYGDTVTRFCGDAAIRLLVTRFYGDAVYGRVRKATEGDPPSIPSQFQSPLFLQAKLDDECQYFLLRAHPSDLL